MVDAPNEGKMLSRAYRFESCPDYKHFNNMANVTKPKRKVATTLLNVDLPNRLQNLQIRRNKIKADAEPIVSIADLHNEAIEMLLRKEQL
jgi:hypothetical protein